MILPAGMVHFVPVKASVQLHVYPFLTFKFSQHDPKFMHGELAQAPIFLVDPSVEDVDGMGVAVLLADVAGEVVTSSIVDDEIYSQC